MYSVLWPLPHLASCTHCFCCRRSCRTIPWHGSCRCWAIWSLMQRGRERQKLIKLTPLWHRFTTAGFKFFYLRGFCHRSARWVRSWWWAEPALNSLWLSHLQQGWKELRRALCSPRRDVTLLTTAWDATFSKRCLSKGGWTTDQDDLLLQEADVDAVNVDVNLVQERYLLVTATSDVLSLHLQLCQTDFLDIVPPGKNVGVRALEVMGDAVKCFVVRIPWDGAPVKFWKKRKMTGLKKNNNSQKYFFFCFVL